MCSWPTEVRCLHWALERVRRLISLKQPPSRRSLQLSHQHKVSLSSRGPPGATGRHLWPRSCLWPTTSHPVRLGAREAVRRALRTRGPPRAPRCTHPIPQVRAPRCAAPIAVCVCGLRRRLWTGNCMLHAHCLQHICLSFPAATGTGRRVLSIATSYPFTVPISERNLRQTCGIVIRNEVLLLIRGGPTFYRYALVRSLRLVHVCRRW